MDGMMDEDLPSYSAVDHSEHSALFGPQIGPQQPFNMVDTHSQGWGFTGITIDNLQTDTAQFQGAGLVAHEDDHDSNQAMGGGSSTGANPDMHDRLLEDFGDEMEHEQNNGSRPLLNSREASQELGGMPDLEDEVGMINVPALGESMSDLDPPAAEVRVDERDGFKMD